MKQKLEELNGLDATKKAVELCFLPGSSIDLGYRLWRNRKLNSADIKKIAVIEIPRMIAYFSAVYQIFDYF